MDSMEIYINIENNDFTFKNHFSETDFATQINVYFQVVFIHI